MNAMLTQSGTDACREPREKFSGAAAPGSRDRRTPAADRRPFPHSDIPTAMLVRLTGGRFAVIDAADADAVNHRRANIRPCTPSQNLANSKIHRENTSGFKGVSADVNGRWRAQIRAGGKVRNLGRFATPEEASAAYLAAAAAVHGEFARAS